MIKVSVLVNNNNPDSFHFIQMQIKAAVLRDSGLIPVSRPDPILPF